MKLNMKLNSEKLYLLSSAVLTVALATTSASANKPTNLTNVAHNNLVTNNPTYTASGTMDKKTALMLTNLLRNPHLQVRAEINGQSLQTISPKPATKNPMSILANYTITGKTDRKTVLRLKKLLQNSRQLQITAKANFNTNTRSAANTAKAPTFQNHTQFVPGYTPFYSNMTPPTYVQGNTLWVPVLINQPIVSATLTTPTAKPEMVAGK